MKQRANEKIYIIFNLAAKKQYVGKTQGLNSRCRAHVRDLRAGAHDNRELQRDWDRDGEDSFIWVDVLLRVGQMRAGLLEDLLIDTLQTLEPAFGYNRMTSRGWSKYARLCDLERKLIRLRKYKLIPGLDPYAPISDAYLEAFWKGHGKKVKEESEVEESEDEWDELEEWAEGGESLEDPDESEEDALRDGEEGEGWEEEERRAGEEGEEGKE
jgi:hypothetical protein